MGKLAEDMIRLTEEIKTMRAERLVFVRNLRTSVAKLREEFRKAHAQMAQESRAQRQELLHDLRAARAAWAALGATRYAPGEPMGKAELEAQRVAAEHQEQIGREERKPARDRRRTGPQN